ncbi:MAG: hypothetical protein LBS08_01625 [Candidatus Symbiothrix sp.]|nr:hypothetical protein [Candidatus Symbiothrix sp.]
MEPKDEKAMQTKGRTLQPSGKHTLKRVAADGSFAGDKHSKKDASIGEKPAGNFLNTVFRPIPATRFHPLCNGNNYDFLYRSARNYSKLLGSSFYLKKQEKDFAGLFRYFEGLLPQGQYLMMVEENKKLLFKIFFGNDFLIGEVFFIPIEILNRTGGKIRDIILTFFQLFQQTHKLARKEHLYDYEMIVDGYLDGWYENDNDPQIEAFLKAYRNGYINDTFSLVYRQANRSSGELEKLIESYTSKNDREENLLKSIKQGINIIDRNKNIFDYVCRPEKNDENFYDVDDECIIEAGRLIRFVYSGNDYVTDGYLEYINTESMDMACEYFPRNSLLLTPATDRLLEVDFVECFFTWLTGFIKNLYDYEDE